MATTRVLLIERDEADRRTHAAMLRFVGFQVLEASGVAAALRLARREHPDLIFLDLGLPGVDGGDPLGPFRSEPATEGTPVAALTDRLLGEAELEAAGYCAQVERPVQAFRLVEEAESCLGSPDESLGDPDRLALHGLAIPGAGGG